MKTFLKAVWEFFRDWGEYRYRVAKKNGYISMY